MKKLFVTLALILVLVFALAACNGHTHTFGEWKITKESTCTEDGHKERVCSCGEKETENIAKHTFDQWVVLQEPTCMVHGLQVKACACGEKNTSSIESIPAPGHSFGEWIVDLAATCVSVGAHHHVCSVCSTSVSEAYIDTDAHNYSTTWTSNDVNHWHVCQNVGCTSVLGDAAHTFGEWIIDEAATCVSTGTRHHVCSVCNKSVSETYSDSTAHNYASTWTTDGTNHWHKCQNSGCTSVSGDAHSFGEWIIDKAATCVSTGTRHHVCSVCNKSVSETYSDPTAHNYASTWTTDGTNHWHKCQNSGCTSITGKTAHTASDWIVDIAPTANKDGHKHTECTVCKKRLQEETPPATGSIGLAYKVNDDGVSCTVIGIGTCTDNALYIPSNKDGYIVTSIGDDAFEDCTNLSSVTFLENSKLESIGDDAFNGCKNLRSVTIPNSVTTIGYRAFTDCTSLNSVTFGKNSQLTSINYYAFKDCTSLTSITIPDSVTSIGYQAFYGCTGLTSITIPDSVTSIGDDAFYGCTGLAFITIPDSVTSIGDDAFYNTRYYNDAYHWWGWENDVLYIGKHLIAAKDTLSRDFTISQGTLTIAKSAFSCCTGLTSITIPDSVTSIGDEAFFGCESLSSVTFWNNIKLESIGYMVFWGCTGLTSITIPDSVESIGYQAFYNCKNLRSVTFGENSKLESIGDGAFSGCKSLTSITIPNSVTRIDYYAFEDCKSLTSITIPDSVTSICSSAFYNTGYYNNASNWENGVLYIGKYLIRANDSISGSYAIKDGTLCIGDYAFSGCGRLSSVTIPDSVTSIGNGAFGGCTGFTSITIPDSVTSIGGRAFSGCTGLTSITIPDSVTSIGKAPFSSCTGLTSITVESGNAVYHSAGNCLIDTARKTLVLGCKNSVIPTDGSVTSIGSYAFEDCTSLTSITIPDSVTSIGDDAFSICSGLTSITIPDSVTYIGSSAFYNCSSLTSITIPDSVTSIGDEAFSYCSGLTSITIPDSVTSIGEWAFDVCFSLTSIDFGGTKAQWESISKGYGWNSETPTITVHCTDGDIVINN